MAQIVTTLEDISDTCDRHDEDTRQLQSKQIASTINPISKDQDQDQGVELKSPMMAYHTSASTNDANDFTSFQKTLSNCETRDALQHSSNTDNGNGNALPVEALVIEV